ncbi:hypothetical protein [Micromonospora sp. 067-2]|uniref:oxidoreductase n=1 Tax=Micromonospora sp. 067-2 TaxID=2789270 RepID=UPI00397D3193
MPLVPGLATTSMATYYAQRATAGLIITEGVHPSLVGQSNPLTPGLYTPAQVDSWRQVTSAVHTVGGRIFAQIMHGGRISHPGTTGRQPVAPSAVAPRGVHVFTPTGPQLASTPRARCPPMRWRARWSRSRQQREARSRVDLPLAIADEATYYTGGDDGYLTCPPYAQPRATAATPTD